MNRKAGRSLVEALFVVAIALAVPMALSALPASAATDAQSSGAQADPIIMMEHSLAPNAPTATTVTPLYLDDGALQNSSGGWDLPDKGACAADPTKTTRPECVATRFPTYTTSSTCVVSNSPNAPIRSWSTGICTYDTATTQTACETAGFCSDGVSTTQTACTTAGKVWTSRTGLWTSSGSKCTLSMKGYDRNKAVCTNLGGTWFTTGACVGAWVMPNADTYVPAVITGSTTATAPALAYPSNPGPGDQCLRCHRSDTEWNVNRVRDVETFVKTGHKNMARKVTQSCSVVGACSNATYTTASACQMNGATWTPSTTQAACTANGGTWTLKPWAGPIFTCSNPFYTTENDCVSNGYAWDVPALGSYPHDDTGNAFNWTTGQITVSGSPYALTWIYGDWLSAYPRAIYKTSAAAAANTCTDPRFSTSATCTAAFGCSNPSYTTQTICEAAGVCSDTNHTTQSDCLANGQCTIGNLTTQATCVSGGGVWAFHTWATKTPSTWVAKTPGTWVKGAGASYSCGRCHTTGWTSDSAINNTKEPEKSFSGITWDRNGDSTYGVVNLSGTVLGDANKYSSWDQWGITCTRCHGSAAANSGGSCSVSNFFSQADCTGVGGTWTAGYPLPSATTLGRSTHHGVMTSPDGGSGGYCSDPSLSVNKWQCEYLGNTWYAQCSDSWWPTAQQCLDTGGCDNPTYTTQNACLVGTCSKSQYLTQVDCEANAGTWTAAAGRCSIPFYNSSETQCTAAGGSVFAKAWAAKTAGTWRESYCSVGGGTCYMPQYITSGTCTAGGGTWFASGSSGTCQLPVYTSTTVTNESDCRTHAGRWASTWTDVDSCDEAGGKYTGFKARRGQLITSLCTQCHRQETGGLPYDNGANPGMPVKVGPYHDTVTFPSHPHGNQFLNSPHGKFTGTYAQIGTGTFSYDGSGLYKSFFQTEGESAGTGNGCTGCHDVHQSTVAEAGQHGVKAECTECHAKRLSTLMHPSGAGTPLENAATDPVEACEMCHMPGGQHLFRINADASYSTFPSSALMGVVDANTAPDGTFTNAVWVDLDSACGQCHGGGTNHAATTGFFKLFPDSTTCTTAGGTWSAGTSTCSLAGKVLTVVNPAGFAANQKVTVANGYLVGGAVSDLNTYVTAVSGTSVYLVGKGTNYPTSTSVVQNPTLNGAGYMSKTQLAAYARDIHNDKPTVTFSYSIGAPPNTTTVSVTATASCNGTCNVFDWNWGDGTPNGSGVNASHTYAAGGTYAITLTVEQYGVNSNSMTRNVTLTAADRPPTVSSTCAWVANTWTMTLTDTSTDDHGVSQKIVTWGDGTKSTAPPFTHSYTNSGGYVITHKVIDNIGQQSSEIACTTAPNVATALPFTIGGTLYKSDGTTVVGGATVTFRLGTTVVKTVYSAANGTYSGTSLKPGTYTLSVSKSGYAFPTTPVVVGPTTTTTNINATYP